MFLTLGKVNCYRPGLGVGAKIDRFSGEEGGGSDLKVAKTQPVGEDVVTSDSEDRPFVGAVVAAPSHRGHHDFRRDDPRKRMRLTADWQTRVSEATTGESIDDTLLHALELDLSCPRRTGSYIPEGHVGINATPVDSDEEPLVRIATQEDALVFCAESQSAVVVDADLGSSELDVPELVEGRDVRRRRGTLKTPDDSTSPQEPEPVPVRPSRRVALVPQFSGCTPQSNKTLGLVVQLQAQPVPVFLGFRGGSRWHTMGHIPIRWGLQDQTHSP